MNRTRISLTAALLSFTGGIMLAVVCFDLVGGALRPAGAEIPAAPLLVCAGILGGYAAVGLLDALTEHLSERITIEELSRKFLMNATTLKNVFKQVYGTTIAAHMRMHRLEQAALLLQTTKDDIASIAQAVGYDSASRFTTAFREMYGETPTVFRRRRQK